jgi:hypothetical protein
MFDVRILERSMDLMTEMPNAEISKKKIRILTI